MISPGYVRVMAEYNSEMNRRLYGAASRLSDEQRRADGGAFWHSIHGTLNHLLWGDGVWMARFEDLPRPAGSMRESPSLIHDFAALRAAREDMDRRIGDWAEGVTQDWLDQDLVWRSGGDGAERRRGRSGLVMHFFNHQTHHRGQVHALITRAGEATGDTDLFLVVAHP